MPGTRFNLTITSSGGEIPGEATVWPPIEYWTSFGTIEGPLRNGDRVRVDNLEPGVGHAEYNGADWELRDAIFPTVADMLGFGHPILTDSIAIVGTGDETDSVYYYVGGEWVRTPENTKYIWPNKANWSALDLITEPQDGDEVLVEFLGISTSYGIAKWSETAVDWELQEVTYAGWDPYGFSDVFLTIGTIANGALLRSDDGSQGGPIYFWNSTGSEWVRSPEDVAYTWSPVTLTNWAGLTSLEGILAGDRAESGTWTTGGTSGVARYDGTNWRLVEGVVNSIANLLAFTGEKETGAKVTVGTGIAADPVYFWSGSEWLRTADGSHYIWPQVSNWSELTTLRPHAIPNDKVHVHSLGPAHSSGTAQLHGGTWKLVEGRWTSVSDMNDWAEGEIHPGAIAFIDPTHHYDEDSTVYYRSESNWVRMANNVPFTWDITDLTNIDPSGIGATQIGDFGRYTNPTTSAVEVYRLRSVPAVGSINLTVWVPASIYGEAGLTIRGYLIGTETMPASGSNIQGYLVNANGASASVTTSGGEVVITSTTISHFALIQSTYALQPSDQYYVRMNIRLSQTAATAMTFYNLLYDGGTTQPQFISTQNPNIELGKYIPSTTTPTLVGSTLMIRGGGTAIVNTAEVLEVLADGTAANLVNVTRNARPYFSMRRNAQTGTATGQHLIQTFQNATGAQTARLSYLYFMTY